MSAKITILSEKSVIRVIDWIAREVSYRNFRVEKVLLPTEPGSQTDILDRKIPVRWIGTAAGSLGLTGTAKISDVKDLFQNGFLPTTYKTVRPPQVKNALYGLVLAAPKSISCLLAHPDPRVRAAVDEAMLAGEAAAINTLETFARSRIGTAAKDNLRSVPVGGLVAASWQHRSSPMGYPHASVNILILSTAPCADGKWRTLDSSIFLHNVRVADAASIVAIEKSISKSLGLSDDDWSDPFMAGSVKYRDIKLLQKFTGFLSGGNDHLYDIWDKIKKVPWESSYDDHAAAWRLHRKNKKFLAEKIEHEIDVALVSGRDADDAIRDYWDKKCNEELLDALSKIRFSENPTPVQVAKEIPPILNFDKEIGDLSKSKISLLNKLWALEDEVAEISARVAREKKSILRFFPVICWRLETKIRDDVARLDVLKREVDCLKTEERKIDENISKLNEDCFIWEGIEANCLFWLKILPRWNFYDAQAWVIGNIKCDARQSALIVADFIDRWSENYMIDPPIPEKIKPIIESMLIGDDVPPAKLYYIMVAKKKFVDNEQPIQEVVSQKIEEPPSFKEFDFIDEFSSIFLDRTLVSEEPSPSTE